MKQKKKLKNFENNQFSSSLRLFVEKKSKKLRQHSFLKKKILPETKEQNSFFDIGIEDSILKKEKKKEEKRRLSMNEEYS